MNFVNCSEFFAVAIVRDFLGEVLPESGVLSGAATWWTPARTLTVGAEGAGITGHAKSLETRMR